MCWWEGGVVEKGEKEEKNPTAASTPTITSAAPRARGRVSGSSGNANQPKWSMTRPVSTRPAFARTTDYIAPSAGKSSVLLTITNMPSEPPIHTHQG